MAKGRKPIQIDKQELVNALEKLESEKVFNNRSELWPALCETEFAKQCQPRPLTSQVAMLLCKRWGIEPKTAKGRKGREKGQGMPEPNKPRAKKKRVSAEELQNLVKILPVDSNKKVPDRYLNLLNKAGKGSTKAFIKLKCLDCSCFEAKEVKNCAVKSCPLYPIRPYKN